VSRAAFRIGDTTIDSETLDAVRHAKEGPGLSAWGRTREHLRRAVEQGERLSAMARSNPQVLRAAGAQITSMSSEQLRIVAGHRQQWQTLAWGYRDMVGELRYALRFRANANSKVKFFIAEVNPDSEDDEPIPASLRHDEDTEKAARVTLPDDILTAAEEELRRLPLSDGYGFIGVWSENFDVAGECYLHGYRDTAGVETWKIRSIDDVDISGNTVMVKNELGQPRRVDLGTADNPGTEELYRLWVPHPRKGHLADSALNAVMDVLEDITLIGRELRAAARSRIASNGVWLVPQGMTMLRNTAEESDKQEDRSARFMADITAAMLAPISNEGDAGAVVPILVTGSRDDIEVASKSFIRFEREDSTALLAKLEKSLGRLAASIDIPPEILSGMAQVNHWTAWQIDAATFKQHLEPSIRMMADSLTSAFIRTALARRGFAAEQIARVRVWFSAGAITENPNRRQDALDARANNAISDKAFRDALGFGDEDAPSAEEVLAMIAAKTGFDQAAAASILRWAAEQAGGELPPLPTPGTAPQIPRGRQAPAQAPADDSGTGGTGTPGTAPPAIAAAAKPLVDMVALQAYADQQRATQADLLVADLTAYADQQPPRPAPYRLDTATGRALAEIERALRDRILTAADAALTRALDRAGSRLRSKAAKDPALTASLRPYAVADWPMRLGREQCFALDADTRYLLAQAWEELSGKFARWVLSAIGRIVPKVLKLAGVDPKSRDGKAAAERMTAEMAARVDGAWDQLAAKLDAHAERRMFADNGSDLFGDEGELPEIDIPPGFVRVALAEVGGMPEQSAGVGDRAETFGGEPTPGLLNGTTVQETLDAAGVLEVGYLWVYGITPLKRQFEPHAELEGIRFTSWADTKLTSPPGYQWVGPFLHPGDHAGCMCDAVPGYAVPDYAQQVRDRLTVPPPNMRDILALAESDDRAGRTGTTAQETRDHYLDIQTLQTRFLEGE
jgi:hypothetical protein